MTDEEADGIFELDAVSAPGANEADMPAGLSDEDETIPEPPIDPYHVMAQVDPQGAEALRDEWGTEFDANLALAQIAAGTLADPALVDLLEENGLGNDPRIVRIAAKIGRLLHDADRRVGVTDGTKDRASLEDTLDELSRSPDYWTDRIQRRVRQINLALHGDGPIANHRTIGDAGGAKVGDARSSR